MNLLLLNTIDPSMSPDDLTVTTIIVIVFSHAKPQAVDDPEDKHGGDEKE